MRVVIVSASFFESSIPLAKQLSNNHDVNFYALVSLKFLTPPNLDITGIQDNQSCLEDLFSVISSDHYLRNYLQGSKLHFRLMKISSKHYSMLKVVRHAVAEIKQLKPDVIHFVGDHPVLLLMKLLLLRFKRVHSFHEIDVRRTGLNEPKSIKLSVLQFLLTTMIRFSITTGEKIILHSENLYKEFSKQYSYPRSIFIPYGLFEIYTFIRNNKTLHLPQNYVLFFGYNRFYKGGDILMAACMKILANHRDAPHFVFAGKNMGTLKEYANNPKILIIDKYLSDEEITQLVEGCSVLVAPHRIASQSGLPNTAFAFDKQVIASNVSGLNQLIIEGKNGLIFTSGDADSLSEQIIHFFSTFNQAAANREHCALTISDWETLASVTSEFYSN